jgi:hypothetical protein
MKLPWKQAVPLLLIGLLCGLWAGVFLPRAALWCRRHRGAGIDPSLNKISRELKLDSRQQEAVKAVLESYRVETKALHEEVATRLAGIRGRINDDIAKQLTPEQQTKFQEMRARWDARRKTWGSAPR